MDDYAAKLWSGLIRDYYLPRWQQYRQHGSQEQLAAWEKDWVESQRGLSSCAPYAAPIAAALELLELARNAKL